MPDCNDDDPVAWEPKADLMAGAPFPPDGYDDEILASFMREGRRIRDARQGIIDKAAGEGRRITHEEGAVFDALIEEFNWRLAELESTKVSAQ